MKRIPVHVFGEDKIVKRHVFTSADLLAAAALGLLFGAVLFS